MVHTVLFPNGSPVLFPNGSPVLFPNGSPVLVHPVLFPAGGTGSIIMIALAIRDNGQLLTVFAKILKQYSAKGAD